MKAKLTIGTRQSLLALWQSNHIAALLRKEYPECEVVLKKIVTKGDRILDVPLAQIGGKGLFTKEIEEDLLDGTVDLAVPAVLISCFLLMQIRLLNERFHYFFHPFPELPSTIPHLFPGLPFLAAQFPVP